MFYIDVTQEWEGLSEHSSSRRIMWLGLIQVKTLESAVWSVLAFEMRLHSQLFASGQCIVAYQYPAVLKV